MSYHVLWDPDAVEELRRCGTDSSRRGRLLEACRQIDELLSANPENAGEVRDPGRRLTYCDPLWFRYEVDVPGQRVLVSSVWQVERP